MNNENIDIAEKVCIYLEEWLPIFDDIQSKTHIKIEERPWNAAYMFTRYAVDTNIKDFPVIAFSQPWYRILLTRCYNWYKLKYGDAVNKKRGNKVLSSFIYISGVPFLIEIPISFAKPGEKSGTIDLVFPKEVYENEDVMEFLKERSIVTLLPEKDKSIIKELITIRVNLLRSIWNNLSTVSIEKPFTKMKDSILIHIDSFVKEIVTGYENGINLGIWELHLAVEKTIKIYILNNFKQFKPVHDLKILSQSIDITLKKEIDGFLNTFPNSHEVIKYRYCEISEFDLDKLQNYYINALEIIKKFSEKMKRKIVMNNAIITIKDIWED